MDNCIFCKIANKEIPGKIIYEDDKYSGTDSDRAAKRMLDAAGVKYTKVAPFTIEVK